MMNKEEYYEQNDECIKEGEGDGDDECIDYDETECSEISGISNSEEWMDTMNDDSNNSGSDYEDNNYDKIEKGIFVNKYIKCNANKFFDNEQQNKMDKNFGKVELWNIENSNGDIVEDENNHNHLDFDDKIKLFTFDKRVSVEMRPSFLGNVIEKTTSINGFKKNVLDKLIPGIHMIESKVFPNIVHRGCILWGSEKSQINIFNKKVNVKRFFYLLSKGRTLIEEMTDKEDRLNIVCDCSTSKQFKKICITHLRLKNRCKRKNTFRQRQTKKEMERRIKLFNGVHISIDQMNRDQLTEFYENKERSSESRFINHTIKEGRQICSCDNFFVKCKKCIDKQNKLNMDETWNHITPNSTTTTSITTNTITITKKERTKKDLLNQLLDNFNKQNFNLTFEQYIDNIVLNIERSSQFTNKQDNIYLDFNFFFYYFFLNFNLGLVVDH